MVAIPPPSVAPILVPKFTVAATPITVPLFLISTP